MSMLRNLVCCVMLAVFPASLMAADNDAAILYTGGSAWLNGSPVPRSSAVFPGDLVQTNRDAAANLNLAGSSVMVGSDSLIKFEGNAVSLEHGAISVASTRKMAARVGGVSVVPASEAWTEFDVRENDGTVQVMARKGDVTVSDDSGTSTLPQGQQTSREEPHKKKKKKAGAVVPGSGPILGSPWAVAAGAGAGGALVWVLVHGDQPLSTDTPSRVGAR